MNKIGLPETTSRTPDRFIGGLLFAIALLIFRMSPNNQISDSKYSVLVSESLLQHQSFMLDFYAVPRLAHVQQRGWIANGSIYHLEQIDNHLYLWRCRKTLCDDKIRSSSRCPMPLRPQL